MEPTAGNPWKISEIAVIFVCLSCWVSGQLRPFLEFTMVLIQRNNPGKSGTVTQPRISRKSKPGYEPGKRGSTMKSLILRWGGAWGVQERFFLRVQPGRRKGGVEVWLDLP